MYNIEIFKITNGLASRYILIKFNKGTMIYFDTFCIKILVAVKNFKYDVSYISIKKFQL